MNAKGIKVDHLIGVCGQVRFSHLHMHLLNKIIMQSDIFTFGRWQMPSASDELI
jgi:hypothetical protein